MDKYAWLVDAECVGGKIKWIIKGLIKCRENVKLASETFSNRWWNMNENV